MLFLWFGTQHTVTGENWNILWALPTDLVAAIALFRNRMTAWGRALFWIAAIACACLLAGWPVIGQDLHSAVIPLAVLLATVVGLGAPGAWMAATTENAVRGLIILRRFRAGAWKEKQV